MRLTNCQNCNKEFSFYPSKQLGKYCSKICRAEGWGKKEEMRISCLQCNKEFQTYPSLKSKFCSNRCHSASTKGKPIEWLKQFTQKGSQTNTGITHFKKGQTPWNKGLIDFQSGDKHYKWQKVNPSYHAVHIWIKKQLGHPNKCEHCKSVVAKRFEWANISRQYMRDINDWIRLCKSCHNKYDNTGYKSWETRRAGVIL